MLSAGKQEMPSDTPPSSRASMANGFGKVLSSVQGLQQRLDDFSIDEISRAHAKAYALIQRLDGFQHQLTALAKLKEAIAGASSQISALPDENLDLIGPGGLERHPQLRAIIQVGRLIRMRRSLREAQASADLSCLSLQSRQSDSDFSINQTNDEISGAPSHPISPPEFGTSPSATNAVEAAMAHAPSDCQILPNEAEFTAVDPEALSTPASPPLAPPSKAAEPIPSSPQRDEMQMASVSRIPEDANSAVKSNFDRRLLSDLIETYGEFAIAATATKSADSATMIPPEALEDPQALVDLISVETAPAEPAFVRSTAGGLLALPVPEEQASRSNLPNLKKQGEIDRQLKSIIKDYGEYDLYSPPKSMNLKMAAIAAFAMLGLVLGSFYFFKASPSVTPAAVEATRPAAIKEAPQGAR
jgi:hypothetical protein